MRDLTREAIEENLKKFLTGEKKDEGLLPTERYASFDYCYNYFQSFRRRGKLSKLTSDKNLEQSCLQIAFYLASWGMLRGSTELLKMSSRHYVSLIELISNTPKDLWDIDIDKYNPESIEKLLKLSEDIKSVIKSRREASDTLSTKIMLGVFGNIPAFDSYFITGFGVWSLNEKSLTEVGTFYSEHTDSFERKIPTVEFNPKSESSRFYTKAKLMDMIFFTEGLKIAEKKEAERKAKEQLNLKSS
ncbi:hypothetical protein FNU79_03705 [Deinococcus detaillensis]|uniref:Uncharacterized protein n=1 Tax=Deinococcus detaillensis TaxID=2592048 RepID=A0A553V537_9DEIO|nr:hypothetical protein [Deinococcus detaillensis]TSA87593.1 hypothetical protein FNU79_03705 [Deinococcus detaillensis]